MRKRSLKISTIIVAFIALQIGCMDRQPAAVCPVPTELNKTTARIGGFEGVDMLVVVDNSGSMKEEQEILATAFFPLVNSLVNPLPGWGFPAADDVRIAIVTSDMGLSWGGNPYQDGDGYPGGLPDKCSESGDDGVFQTLADPGAAATVDIAHDTIDCNSEKQCPPGWTCSAASTEVIGKCQAPGGDGDAQPCPQNASTWLETPIPGTEPPVQNDELTLQVACLAQQGIDGCGFEQQLQSAAKALTRPDQSSFIRENALLVVLVVSDEGDCSIKVGKDGLFQTPEIQITTDYKVNLACGMHPEFLYTSSDFYNTFTNAKGAINAVIFAAIVGVPNDDVVCQGTGDMLNDCLSDPKMALVSEWVPNTTGPGGKWDWIPACTRTDLVSGEEVTAAVPGRSYVQLANTQFGSMSYVYSICNQDWSPAMTEIAHLIASNLKGTCYEKPLDWDTKTRQAKCDVLVEYQGTTGCPEIYNDPNPIEVTVKNENDQDEIIYYCRMPKLSAPKDCAQLDEDGGIGQFEGEFGWFYCETLGREDFREACEDFIDNDEDGFVDCDDVECQPCSVCGGSTDCSGTCKYMVQMTDKAEEEVKQRAISVQCLQQFSFENENCQENNKNTCLDGLDNDGNGVQDCEDKLPDEDPNIADPSYADPSCCPLDVKKEATDAGDIRICTLRESIGDKQSAVDICDFVDVDKDGHIDSNEMPDACRSNAAKLECKLEPLSL